MKVTILIPILIALLLFPSYAQEKSDYSEVSSSKPQTETKDEQCEVTWFVYIIDIEPTKFWTTASGSCEWIVGNVSKVYNENDILEFEREIKSDLINDFVKKKRRNDGNLKMQNSSLIKEKVIETKCSVSALNIKRFKILYYIEFELDYCACASRDMIDRIRYFISNYKVKI